MTAEIVIMNKMAIAMAADSAVTIASENEQKIYNTVNKLFMLSKFHPLGIMIYGNAELMEVPWETIIKVYRSQLGDQSFSRLQDYATDFMRFLEKPNGLFPEAIQADFFKEIISDYFRLLQEEIDKEVKTKINECSQITSEQLESIVTSVIDKFYKSFESLSFLEGMNDIRSAEIIYQYTNILHSVKQEVFENLPISESNFIKLQEICQWLVCKDYFRGNLSGIVIAGFGEQDIFPSQISFTIAGIMGNFLKYKEYGRSSIDYQIQAHIQPFAQSEMVYRFLDGIDPQYNAVFNHYLNNLLEKYPNTIIDFILEEIAQEFPEQAKEFIQSNPMLKLDLIKQLVSVNAQVLNNFNQQTSQYRRQIFVDPVLEIVKFMPKDELALMAESLVSLTSFKRKISMEAETVGGPIDVAVISKGDGFIWIKRKHYFKPDLNPYFLENYFRTSKSPGAD